VEFSPSAAPLGLFFSPVEFRFPFPTFLRDQTIKGSPPRFIFLTSEQLDQRFPPLFYQHGAAPSFPSCEKPGIPPLPTGSTHRSFFPPFFPVSLDRRRTAVGVPFRTPSPTIIGNSPPPFLANNGHSFFSWPLRRRPWLSFPRREEKRAAPPSLPKSRCSRVVGPLSSRVEDDVFFSFCVVRPYGPVCRKAKIPSFPPEGRSPLL